MHPANVVLMRACHIRRRTSIKTLFVYCHVFAGMDTMDIYSTHHDNIGIVGGEMLHGPSKFD